MNNWSNLAQRIVAGLVGVAIMLAGLLWNSFSYAFIMTGIVVVTLNEFYKLAGLAGYSPLKGWGIALAVALVSLPFLVFEELLATKWLVLLVPLTFALFLVKLADRKDTYPFTSLGWTLLGVCYIALPVALGHLLVYLPTGSWNTLPLLGMFLILWGYDTAAYFVGKLFGKHQLAPNISPKKTWEGAAGGTVLALAVALVVAQYFTQLPLVHWLVIAALVVVVSTLGDLVESRLKRSLSLKDAAATIPGHGGFLDRFDGLLLALPAVITFLILFPPR